MWAARIVAVLFDIVALAPARNGFGASAALAGGVAAGLYIRATTLWRNGKGAYAHIATWPFRHRPITCNQMFQHKVT